MKVTIFGGSKPKQGEQAYEDAFRLGGLLAQAGFTVVTGGYIGTMEAVSRGASEAGGHVVGITCDEIEAWRPVKCNPWVAEEVRFSTLRQRLMALVEDSDAAMALPGGVGTLTEITVMWNHLLTQAIPEKPLILIGPEWKAVIEAFFGQLGAYIPPEQRRFVTFAQDVDEAVASLRMRV